METPQLKPDITPQERHGDSESYDGIFPKLAEDDIDYTGGQLPEPDLGVAEYKGLVPEIEPDVIESVQYADEHPVTEYNGPGEVPTLEPFDPTVGITGAMKAKMQYLVNPPNDVL